MERRELADIATQLEGCLGKAQRQLLAILKEVAQKVPAQDWALWLKGNLELLGDRLLEAEDLAQALKSKAQELVERQEESLRGETKGR
jgi:hypothetical protein